MGVRDGYSARVNLRLVVAGRNLALSHVGPSGHHFEREVRPVAARRRRDSDDGERI